MKLQLKYFASLADTLGCDEEVIDVADSTSDVSAIKALLSARGDIWRNTLSNPNTRCAVNQHIAQDSTELSDHAEVAFFPPVTGG